MFTCFEDPSKVLSVLSQWSDSERCQSSLEQVGQALRDALLAKLNAPANKSSRFLSRGKGREMKRAAVVAIGEFHVEVRHLKMLLTGDLHTLLMEILGDTAIGALDALTEGLQNKLEKATKVHTSLAATAPILPSSLLLLCCHCHCHCHCADCDCGTAADDAPVIRLR